MMSKFSRRAAATASLVGWSWLLGASGLPAQTPLQAPGSAGTARPPKPKVAHLRFLNLLPLDGGDLALLGAGSADSPLQIAPPANFYSTYVNFPPVHAIFKVARRTSLQTPIKSLDVPLKGDGYFTILAQPQPNGQPTVDLVDETPDPDKPPTNQLTVRQYFRGAQAVVSTAGGVRTNPLAYGDTQTLANLPDGIVPLSVVVTTVPGVPPRMLNVDANFQRARRATIFIVTDPYDRLRPRVINDGPSRAEEDAAAAERRAANPTTP